MGDAANGPKVERLGLAEWSALNDEIAALVRSGLPLDRGLASAGADLRGRAGRAATAISERLERGEGLAEAIEGLGPSLPPSYRAVVSAGVRSGKLASALEGVASHARNRRELRRALAVAMIYPAIVAMLAYATLVGFLWVLLPRILDAAEGLVDRSRFFDGLGLLGQSVWWWWPVGPVLVLAFLGLWWSGRDGRIVSGLLRVVPGVGDLLRFTAWSAFTELLALQVEHRVPLDEALELCGDASNDRALQTAGRHWAEAIRLGSVPRISGADGLPPMVAWHLLNGRNGEGLAASLRDAAGIYRRRAGLQADFVRTVLPVLAIALLGATTVLIYALVLFAPGVVLLRQLADPTN